MNPHFRLPRAKLWGAVGAILGCFLYRIAASDQGVLLTHRIFEALVNRHYQTVGELWEPSLFSPQGLDRLGATWHGLVEKNGHFIKVTEVRSESVNLGEAVTLEGQFALGTIALRVVWNPGWKMVQVSPYAIQGSPKHEGARLPPYADPLNFREEERGYGDGGFVATGTLTLPRLPPPYRLAILVPGLGKRNRDLQQGEGRLYRDLALGLAGRGIATFRFDSPMVREGELFFRRVPTFTPWDAFLRDAVAAAWTLGGTTSVARDGGLFFIGHDLGATLLPRLASHFPRTAGFVMLAPIGRPLEEALFEYRVEVAWGDGTINDRELEFLAFLKKQFHAVDSERENREGIWRMAALGGVPVEYFQFCRAHSAIDLARALRQPSLIVYGERDDFAREADHQLYRLGLTATKTVKFKTIPHVRPQFSRPSEVGKQAFASRELIDTVADWIKEVGKATEVRPHQNGEKK